VSDRESSRENGDVVLCVSQHIETPLNGGRSFCRSISDAATRIQRFAVRCSLQAVLCNETKYCCCAGGIMFGKTTQQNTKRAFVFEMCHGETIDFVEFKIALSNKCLVRSQNFYESVS
jgi:hypothetical protein